MFEIANCVWLNETKLWTTYQEDLQQINVAWAIWNQPTMTWLHFTIQVNMYTFKSKHMFICNKRTRTIWSWKAYLVGFLDLVYSAKFVATKEPFFSSFRTSLFVHCTQIKASLARVLNVLWHCRNTIYIINIVNQTQVLISILAIFAVGIHTRTLIWVHRIHCIMVIFVNIWFELYSKCLFNFSKVDVKLTTMV